MLHRAFAWVSCLVVLLTLFGCAKHARPVVDGVARLEPKPAPDFTLTRDDGTPYHLAEKRGREVVLFFGYTHCPDVCPTTLANLETAYRTKLTPRQKANVDIVFVTVDPARDTLAQLAKFVHLFGPNVIGLRGNDVQLAAVEKSWHLWHQRTHVTKRGYDMAHGSTVYIVAPNGDLVAAHDWADTTETIGADLAAFAS